MTKQNAVVISNCRDCPLCVCRSGDARRFGDDRRDPECQHPESDDSLPYFVTYVTDDRLRVGVPSNCPLLSSPLTLRISEQPHTFDQLR